MILNLFRSIRILFVSYLLIVLVFAGFGYSIYQSDKKNELAEQSADLRSTAKFKNDLIEGWYNDRFSDSEILFKQNLVQSQILNLLNSSKKEDHQKIRNIVTEIFNKKDYYNIFIIDQNEKIIFKLFSNRSVKYLKDSLKKSIKNNKIVFTNIYSDSKTGLPSIDISYPLRTSNNSSLTVVIKIDPRISLYPLVSSWYKKHSTGESFIVSKNSKSIIYLSPLKYKSGTKFYLKESYNKDSFIGKTVINNSKGLGQYLDYRGTIVLADVRPIKNMQWYLITKLDMPEVYKRVRNNTLRNLLSLSLIIFLGGLLLIYFYTKTNLNNLKKINEAENKFKSIFDNSTDAVLIIDDNKIIDCNSSALKLFDLPKKSLIGKNPGTLSPELQPDGKQSTELAIELISKTLAGEPQKFEWIHKAKLKLIYLNISLSTIKKNDEKYVTAFLHDITKQKQALESLQDSEEKYRKLVENINDIVYSINAEGVITFVSNTVEKILGYKQEEIIGRSFTELIYPDDLSLTLENFDKIKMNLVQKGEYRILTKSGNVRYMTASSKSSIKDSKFCGINGILVDITENKKAEEKLRFHDYLLNEIGEAIMATDNKGIIIYWNHAAEKLYGWKSEEVIGKNVLDIIPQQSVKKETEVIFENLTKGITWRGEFILQRKDDSTFYGLVTYSPLFNGEADITAIVVISEDISERKKTEEALKESEVHFRNLSDSGQVLIWASSKTRKPDYFNKVWLEFTGRELEQQIKGGWSEVVHPDDLQNCIKIFTDSFDQKKNFNMDYRLQRFDGVYRWIQDNGTPRYNFKNEFIGYIHHCLDITDRKNTETELENAFDQLNNLYKNLPEAVFSVDSVNHKMIKVSPAHKTIFGYSPENFYNNYKLWFDIILPEDKHIAEKGIKLLRKGELVQHQYRCLRPNGTIVWVEAKLNPTLDKDGNLIRIDGISSDITERKNAEQKIRLLSNSIEQSPISIIITDPQGNIDYVNSAFMKTTGFTFEEIRGKYANILKSDFHPNKYCKDLWDTITSGKIWEGEIQNQKKSGELIWEYAIISPVTNENGEITNFVAVEENITEKKKMIEELIDSKEKAEESNRLKSIFLSNMSHELRTPMVGILGFTELLEQEIIDSEHLEMLKSITISSQRLLDTLNSILDLARIEANKYEISFSEFSINEFIKEEVRIFEGKAITKNLFLSYHPCIEDIIIKSDKNILHSIISNLINNAIKFTYHGGVTIRCNVIRKEEKDFINLKVADSGIGIPEESKKLIFEEFRQASEGFSRNFEGTGLGLSITNKLVHFLNGEITVQSTGGMGSTFSVMIPVIINKTYQENKIEQKSLNKTDGYNNKPASIKNLLIVENDSVTINILNHFLRNYYKIDITNNGTEAVDLASNNNYDLIIMDINLGKGADGITVTRIIKKMSKYKYVPIIAATAFAMEADRNEFLAAGCTDYISKPFTKNELLNIISTNLDKSNANFNID